MITENSWNFPPAENYISILEQLLFYTLGFCNEILTDYGSNIMPKLLKHVYQLVGIKALRTTRVVLRETC